jgi:acetoin utilization protein AcuB
MTVRELMQKEVFVVSPEDSIDRVFFLMHFEKIRHLPVVNGREVVGIVSDRDLYKALGPKSRRGPVAHGKGGTQLFVIPKKARHIMRRGVLTIEPEAPIKKAASMMATKKIGALPVVKDGRLVGILTATDLLRVLAKLAR